MLSGPWQPAPVNVRKWGPWAGVVIIYVASACIAVPLLVGLILGFAALGFETGWWPGDYNMNDGEGWTFTFFSLMFLAVLAAAAGLGARHCLELAGADRAQRWLPIAASSTIFAITVTLAFAAVLAWY